MTTQTEFPRRRRPAAAALALAGVLALTGCGDIDDLNDLNDFIDEAQEYVDEFSDEVEASDQESQDSDDPSSQDDDEPGSEYEERMREAREDWDTYPEPPADIPPSKRPYDYATTHRDGSRSATEKNTYPADEAEPLADYYTEQYGSEPTIDGDKRTWSNENATTTMETNFDGSVTTKSQWYPPSE